MFFSTKATRKGEKTKKRYIIKDINDSTIKNIAKIFRLKKEHFISSKNKFGM